MTTEKTLPTDSSSGGAHLVMGLKHFKSDKTLEGLTLLRVSTTIARQELLALARMINRDCFGGQFADPALLADTEGSIEDKARYFINETGGMCYPTIVFSRPRLLCQTITEMWPDLLRCMAIHWSWTQSGNPNVDESSEDFKTKLAFINENANPSFVRSTYTPEDEANLRKDMAVVNFVDEWLSTLSQEDISVLASKCKDKTETQKRRRNTLLAELDERHKATINNLHKKQRFVSPSNSMIKKRAELALKANGEAD